MLMQNGGPGQMELFDPKPELASHAGQTFGEKVEMFQNGSEANKLLASPFKFRPAGQCGMELSEVIPHLASVADDVCLVRSMHTEHNNHTEALVMFNTGKIFPGRPGAGLLDQLRPGDRKPESAGVHRAARSRGLQHQRHAAVAKRLAAGPVSRHRIQLARAGGLNLRAGSHSPRGPSATISSFLAQLNEEHRRRYPHESELEARIRNYELAARMQLAAGETLDLSRETAATQKLYGLDNPETAGYGLRCLMARRLVESGVRFVQIFPPVKPQFQPWDSHTNVKTENEAICAQDRSAQRRPDQGPQSSADCWIRRSCSGAASSAGCRSRRMARAGTTIATPSA